MSTLSELQGAEPRFARLTERLIWSLRCGGFVKRPLAERFARRWRGEQRGELELQTQIFDHTTLGEVRFVTINSPRIDFINLFAFPHPGLAYPCFTMEMVVLGPKPILGAIDLVDLSGCDASVALAQDGLNLAHQRFPLPASTDVPDWYQSCRSGADFFVRPENDAQLQRLCQAQECLWQHYVSQWPTATPLAKQEITPHARRQLALRHHHRDYTPGLRLLERSFGKAWTRDYLHDCIFA